MNLDTAIIVAAIAALALIAQAIITAITARNVAKSNEHIAELKTSVDSVVHNVDGKLEKMLGFMQDANYRKGIIDERDRTEARNDLLTATPPEKKP